ncbi:hypothetical protein [Fusibacter sp. JL216-2]|uniref:hypothetical protein n=1 Tax=Fusibacter sp. JL216-2 TaxID=3071453 RepID=UPI003D33C477
MNTDRTYYLQSKNKLFGRDVLSICYKVSRDDIEKYGLTSDSIVVFMCSDVIDEVLKSQQVNYSDVIAKSFLNRRVLLRVQSECFLGVYGDSHCDCDVQRAEAAKLVGGNDGIFIHMPQEAQGWGLHYKLSELELQVSGRMPDGNFVGCMNRDEAQKKLTNSHKFSDKRSYDVIEYILKDLNLIDHEVLLLTDSSSKINALRERGVNAVRYSAEMVPEVTEENIAEYLIKIDNRTHDFDIETIDKIFRIIRDRRYNDRALSVLCEIVSKLKNDEAYCLDETLSEKIISTYNEIICGEEKKYIIYSEKNIKIQKNFSCKVTSMIFKALVSIYGHNIFDRVSEEKIYYFKNKKNGEMTRVRTSKILDTVEDKCDFFKGQIFAEESGVQYSSVVQKEITVSKLNSYFENSDFDYVKRVEMITMVAEGTLSGINLYIKRIPKLENHIMDIYGDGIEIRHLIDKLVGKYHGTLLSHVTDEELASSNFSEYNLRFSNLDCVIKEAMNNFKLTKL